MSVPEAKGCGGENTGSLGLLQGMCSVLWDMSRQMSQCIVGYEQTYGTVRCGI